MQPNYKLLRSTWNNKHFIDFIFASQVVYISYQVKPTTGKNHILTLVYMSKRMLALGPRFGLVLGPQGRLLWFPGVAIFELLGGAGDIDNSTSMPNYCDGPYVDLGIYTTEVPSVWTAVLSILWPSSARFCLAGVAIWADFRDFVHSGRGWWYK